MMRRSSPIRVTLVLAAGIVMSNGGLVASVQARDAFGGSEPFGELAALPDRTLASQRGGVRVNGIDMDIAVRIETRINDRLQMVSTLLTDAADRITRRTDVLVERLDQAASRTTAATRAVGEAVASATGVPATGISPQAGGPITSQTAGPVSQSSRPGSQASRAEPNAHARPVSERTAMTVAPAAGSTSPDARPRARVAKIDPAPQASQASHGRQPAGSVGQAFSARTVQKVGEPALSVRHILEGALGTQVVNRLNGQRIQNRIEMTVTLRNYTAIRQQAQRIRTLGAALRAAANPR